MSAVEKFPQLLNEAEEESSAVPPCFSDEGINVRNVFPLPLSFPLLAYSKTAQRKKRNIIYVYIWLENREGSY
jgi:hypothetical protein